MPNLPEELFANH